MLGIPRATFHRWYDRVWNKIPNAIQTEIVELALDATELSPREIAVRFTDERRYFVLGSSVYRLLKARGLITSPARIVIKAANEFKDKPTAPNEIWQTDFTYLKIVGWVWSYLSARHWRLNQWRTKARPRRLFALHHRLALVADHVRRRCHRDAHASARPLRP